MLIVLLYANDQFLRTSMHRNRASRVNWLFDSESKEYEVAILGSSMAKEGIDPVQLAQKLGVDSDSVVQLAWGGRGVSEQALYFELFLQRHSCKALLLELHPRGLERDVLPHPLDEFRYLARLKDPIVFKHLARQFGSVNTSLWQRVPMWGFALFSTQVGWHDVLASRKANSFEPNALISEQHLPVVDLREHAATLEEQFRDPSRQSGFTQIDPRSQAQFEDVVQLCKNRDIQVVALVPPLYQRESGSTQEHDNPRRVDWLDCYYELLGSDTTVFVPKGEYQEEPAMFTDSLHVNASGRIEYTSELANALAEVGL